MAINQKEILGAALPNIYIDKIILKDAEVQLDFHIKEVYLENGKTSFSSFEILQKYILIKIEQVTKIESFEEAKIKKTSNLGETVKTFQLSQISSSTKKVKNKDIIELHHSCNFKLEKSYSDLGFILYSEFDFDSLSKEFKFSIDKNKFKIQKKYEQVLHTNKLVEILEKYTLQNGSDWEGNVVGNENTGYFTDESPRRPLKKQQYKNTKIQDFRKQTIPENTKKSLNLPANSLVSNSNVSSLNNKDTIKILNNFSSRQEIISDYYEIIDDNNYVSFVFSVNFKNLIEQQSNFLKQFINENNINKILNKTFINNCILYRTKKVANKVNNSSYVLSEQKETVSSIFREYSLLPNLNNKKMFLIKDETSNTIKSGIYEYSLDINIVNGITQYLIENITTLNADQKKFVTYSNLSNYPEYYDKKLGTFKIPQMQLIYNNLQIEQCIINVATIFGELNSYTKEDISKTIEKFKLYSNPSTATIDSIKYVFTFYEQILNNLFKYSGIKIENDGSITTKTINKGSLINIKKTFKNLINLERQYQVKLNFIDIPDNVIDYKNILNSFERVFKEYELTNASNEIKDNIYSSLPPKSIIFNEEKKDIKNNNTNYLESIFTDINLILNKKSKYLLDLKSAPDDKRNDIANCLNFSKLIEQYGVVIDEGLIKPQINNTLNITDDAYYLSNLSLYNCTKGLLRVFNYDSESAITIKNDFLNESNYLSTMPAITQLAFEKTNKTNVINTLFTSGKHIILYRMMYDLEFLDLIDGEIVWKKLTKNIFETKFRNRIVLFRLKQNSSSINYDTSNMKVATNFIVNFK